MKFRKEYKFILIHFKHSEVAALRPINQIKNKGKTKKEKRKKEKQKEEDHVTEKKN